MAEFLDLPFEIVLLIFNYVPGWDLWTKIQFVCLQFNAIVNCDDLWNLKLKAAGARLSNCRRKQANYPLIRNFLAIEREKHRWPSETPEARRVVRSVAMSTCDALEFMKFPDSNANLCVTGSRDRELNVWDVSKMLYPSNEYDSLCKASRAECHAGWIWDISSSANNTFYSCGWDQKLKYWALTESSIKEVACAALQSAVFCVENDGEIVVSGEFNGSALVMDPRNNLEIVAMLKGHRRHVMDLAFERGSNYIYTCSPDRNLRCFDKRTWHIVSNYVFPSTYAVNLSLNEGELACATKHGVYLFDASDLSATDFDYHNEVLAMSCGEGIITYCPPMDLSSNEYLSWFDG